MLGPNCRPAAHARFLESGDQRMHVFLFEAEEPKQGCDQQADKYQSPLTLIAALSSNPEL